MGKERSEKLESELATYFERKIEIDHLKAKHRLTPEAILEGPKEEIRDRVAGYTKDLDKLIENWRKEDAAKAQI